MNQRETLQKIRELVEFALLVSGPPFRIQENGSANTLAELATELTPLLDTLLLLPEEEECKTAMTEAILATQIEGTLKPYHLANASYNAIRQLAEKQK